MSNNMTWLKQNSGKVVLIAIALVLYLRDHDLFWIVTIVYGIGIYLIISNPISEKIRKTLSVIIWVSFFVVLVLSYYVNYYLPHGPSYPTGEIICQNDDRGPCREQYVEDMRNLNIPDWAKIFRLWGIPLLMGLAFAGIVVSIKNKEE